MIKIDLYEIDYWREIIGLKALKVKDTSSSVMLKVQTDVYLDRVFVKYGFDGLKRKFFVSRSFLKLFSNGAKRH